MAALEFMLISKLWINSEILTTDKAIFNFYNLTELHYIYICHIIWLLFLVKEPLWKYITLRNRPGGVSVSICADDRAAGDARKNILGGYYHGKLWLEAKDKMDIFKASPDPPILVDLLDSVCLPSMATRTRTLYPQASSASNGIHNLFCYFVWLTTEFGRPK